MKKKRILFCALFLLTLIMGTGSIYAGKNVATNNVKTGVVNIEIDEYTLDENGKEVPWKNNVGVLPAMTVSKIPYFTATGNDCFIRATIKIEKDFETETPITFENFKDISEDWIRVGDYYYYKYPLKTNESVDFFHSFEVPKEWGNEVNPSNVGDWGFSITVVVDAVQADNFSPKFESNNPWGDIVIEESIHKDGYDVNIFTSSKETNMSILIEDGDNVVVEPEDFFAGFKTMMPGDVQTDSIDINSKERCRVYFTSESLTDIELLQNLHLKLILTKNGTDKVIYDGILDAKIKDLLLGEFKKGETGKLTFTISMPAELGNEFSLRNASVKWTFDSERINMFGIPVTGDSSPSLIFLSFAMLISGIFVIFFAKKKKDE